ncbi:MAG: hypothetical protein AAF412_05320, partial [Pseudomonadota bacterium]
MDGPSITVLDSCSKTVVALEELIESFEIASLNLKVSISKDIDSNIEQYSHEVDTIIDSLMAYECKTRDERRTLCTLLMKQFVAQNTDENCLKTRASKKILSEI